MELVGRLPAPDGEGRPSRGRAARGSADHGRCAGERPLPLQGWRARRQGQSGDRNGQDAEEGNADVSLSHAARDHAGSGQDRRSDLDEARLGVHREGREGAADRFAEAEGEGDPRQVRPRPRRRDPDPRNERPRLTGQEGFARLHPPRRRDDRAGVRARGRSGRRCTCFESGVGSRACRDRLRRSVSFLRESGERPRRAAPRLDERSRPVRPVRRDGMRPWSAARSAAFGSPDKPKRRFAPHSKVSPARPY